MMDDRMADGWTQIAGLPPDDVRFSASVAAAWPPDVLGSAVVTASAQFRDASETDAAESTP